MLLFLAAVAQLPFLAQKEMAQASMFGSFPQPSVMISLCWGGNTEHAGRGRAPALEVLAREILGGSDVGHIEAVIVLVHRG